MRRFVLTPCRDRWLCERRGPTSHPNPSTFGRNQRERATGSGRDQSGAEPLFLLLAGRAGSIGMPNARQPRPRALARLLCSPLVYAVNS